jgi:hypothetical protein
MTENNQTEQGELKILDYGGKILTVYRRCSCGGAVEIHKDETGLNTARCKRCGVHLEWRDGDKLPT